MPGCRCPRCLPFSKANDESEEGHKVRSRTLLAQSRKAASLKKAGIRKPASSGKPNLHAAVKKAPQKQKAVKKAKPASADAPTAEVKKALAEERRGKNGRAKTEAPPKKVSAAVQQIKAWLQGVKKEFQNPTTAGKAAKAEPKKKVPDSKPRQKSLPQKTAPHHLPAEPATPASRPQWPSLAPTALPQVLATSCAPD